MTLPSFLIIGAMKSGTTTLYRDLLTHKQVFFPVSKELSMHMNLTKDDVLTPQGRAEYEELFEDAEPEQVCGEASTDYTKIPKFTGVPERAKQLLGPDIRLVYLMREPLARMISHHYHIYAEGFAPADINRAVDEKPEIVDFSLYGMQLKPWIETFGRDALMAVRFEDYVKDRHGVCAQIMEHIGLEPDVSRIKTKAVYNKSDGKPVMSKGLRTRLVNSHFYRTWIRPHIPVGVRSMAVRWVMPKAPPRPAYPSPETVERVTQRFKEDHELLHALLGDQCPHWETVTQ